MDNPVQDYEFLDLSDLGEDDLSHLRSVLGASPKQQGLTLPWSKEKEAATQTAEPVLEHENTDDNNGPCNWLASPDPSAAHIQFGEPINGGHLDLTSDVDIASGDESSQTVPQDVAQVAAATSPTMLQTSSMGSVVVTTSSQPITSHTDMMHGQGYPPQPEEQHPMYPTFVPNAMYQHPMTYAHSAVTGYQMIDPSQPPPRDQSRGRARKSMRDKREMMHHNQDMMARGHGHIQHYDSYAQYHQYAPYQYPSYAPQMQPVHPSTGSPIYMYQMYEQPMYHPSIGVPQGPKVSYPQAPPVSVPAPIPAQPVAILPPPPMIPLAVPAHPPPVAPVAPVAEPLAPMPAPAPVRIQMAAPAPTIKEVKSPPRTEPRAPVPRAAGPTMPLGASAGGPPAGAVMSGKRPPDVKKPVIVSLPEEQKAGQVSQQTSVTPAPLPQQQQMAPHVDATLPAATAVPATSPIPASTAPAAAVVPVPDPAPEVFPAPTQAPAPAQVPAAAPAPIPAPAAAPTEATAAASAPAPSAPSSLPVPAPVVSKPKSPSPEPAPASVVKAEEPPTTAPAPSAWGGKSFASLFNSRSAGQSSAANTPVPNTYSYDNIRNDGPQAVSPPTVSGWGPMQASNRVHSTQSAVPSGIAPALPLPNPSHDPKLHRLSEFLHQYKLEHKPASLVPRGLTNRNNWCYINATLQALLACPPFYNLFYNMPDTPSGRSSADSHTAIIESMKNFVQEFQHLPASARLKRADRTARSKESDVKYDIQQGPPFEPVYVYRLLSVIQTDNMVEGRQEDAEEFLSCLLNGLNDEMLELMKITDLPNGEVYPEPSSTSPVFNGEAELHTEEEADEWKVMGAKNKAAVTRRADFGRTPLSDIFRGQLRSRVIKSTGSQSVDNSTTDNIQPFFTLQLDIENSSSVKEALEAYVKKDKLEGVTCSRSNQEVMAWQEVQLEELPPVLLLHLKCFDFSQEGSTKIVKSIRYDIDLKVDSRLLSSKKQRAPNQQQYKLFAIVYHDGKETTKGHYITDAFHVGYNSWIRYDDSCVKVMSQTEVLSPKSPRVPYLLYYRRIDTLERH